MRMCGLLLRCLSRLFLKTDLLLNNCSFLSFVYSFWYSAHISAWAPDIWSLYPSVQNVSKYLTLLVRDLSSNLLFAAEINTVATHTTWHLARGGVAFLYFQSVCGDMSRQEPVGGIRLWHYWWWWHKRTSGTGSRRANTMLGVSCGAAQANICRDLGDMLLKQQFCIYIPSGPQDKNNRSGGTLYLFVNLNIQKKWSYLVVYFLFCKRPVKSTIEQIIIST